MKCHYEVLNVPREAGNAEIKTAYRKLALQWHPDKNPDNLQEAKEQFQLIQNAYEVLSDPQERAWYDNHREQLLRGTGSSYNDDSLNVFPYFSPSCYKGFSDDSKGFYAVYSEVFSKLAAEETDFLDDPEDVNKIPQFGTSDTPFDKVHEFYAYWMSFSTSKSYAWLDQYDIKQGDNRRVIKLMEKENNKIRQKARKERNEEIRRLVSFVRRKDKRVLEHAKLLLEKAEENKKKAEKLRNERIIQRQKEIKECQKAQGETSFMDEDYMKRLNEIETLVQEEFGISSDDTVSDDGMESSNEDSSKTELSETSKAHPKTLERDNKVRNLYCTACNKLFKNVKSFENHEKSKKHKENVAHMPSELEISDHDDNDAPDNAEQCIFNNVDKETVNDVDADEDLEKFSDESENFEQKVRITKKKKNKKKVFVPESDGNDSHDELSLNDIEAPSRSRRAKKMSTAKLLLSELKQTQEETSVELTEENEKTIKEDSLFTDNDIGEPSTNKEKLKLKKPNLKGRKGDSDEVDLNHFCAVCKSNFSSKNKLFDHLKKTGHSIPLSEKPTIGKKGKKAKR